MMWHQSFQQEKESVKTWSVPCLLKKRSLSGCLNSAWNHWKPLTKCLCKSGGQTFLVLTLMIWLISKRHQTNLLVTGKMFLRKSRKLLNVLVFQKQNVPILLEPQLSMSQKWFTTIWKKSMTSWVLSLQIQIQHLKSIQNSLRSTSQNWFRQQITNLRPLTLPSGQVVPLFMYQKALR